MPDAPRTDSLQLFEDIFERCAFLFALLVGEDGLVLASNERAKRFFRNTTNCAPWPLVDVLADGQEECSFLLTEAASSGKNLPLVLETVGGERFGADFSVAELGREKLLFARCSDDDENAIITEMSVLNLEMANMTRELHKKNLQLAVSQQALARSDSMKKTFLAIIAHDLRGHVGGVGRMLSMLQEDYDGIDDDEKRECLALAAEEARRTFLLLEDLLSWSRSQLDQIEFNPVGCNLRVLIEENIALMKSRAEEKGITLSLDAPPFLTAIVDTGMIGTTLRNILSNALKFTPPGGSVHVAASLKGADVEIVIRDTGIGMPKEIVESIFRIDAKRASRKGTSGESGTGLGLILCKEFVEKHGGSLRAESVPREGSAFFISLPSVR